MKALPPLAYPFCVADAMLTSSGVVDVAANGEWGSGTTYGLGDIVSRGQPAPLGRLKFYKSLQAGNLNQNPDTQTAWWAYIGDGYKQYNATATYAVAERVLDNTNHRVYEALAVMSNPVPALSDDTKWLPIGPSNRWAMFDLYNNIATSVPGSLPVVITPGERINALSLHGLAGATLDIVITSGADVIYSESFSLRSRKVLGLYQRYYEPFATRRSLALFNLPQGLDRVVSVTITAAAGGVAACERCLPGRAEDMGKVEWGQVFDTVNFSTVERNFDSSINKMTPRRAVPKRSGRLILPAKRGARVAQLLGELNAVPFAASVLDDLNDSPWFEPFHGIVFIRSGSMTPESALEGVVDFVLEEI